MKFFVKDFGSGAHLYMFDVPSGHLGVDPSRCAIKPRIESDALGRLIGGSEFAVGVQDKHEPLLYTIHNNDSDSFGMLSEDYCNYSYYHHNSILSYHYKLIVKCFIQLFVAVPTETTMTMLLVVVAMSIPSTSIS